MRKLVVFTFDYELFLGDRSGPLDGCLLEPTRRLLQLFGEFGFKAVFFVDTVYLMRLQELARQHPAAATDWMKIREQLKTMAGEGHYLFPHVHPHWLDAVYLPEENQWSLKDLRYYRFSALDTEQQRDLFSRSVVLIREVVGEEQIIDGYRAGGWSIQPFGDFRPLFLKYGITQEWSVIPGKYHFSDAQQYDFRTAPAGRPVYRFDEDPCLQAENGPFTEWTISTLALSRFEKWLDFKVNGFIHRFIRKRAFKGSTVSSTMEKEGDVLAAPGQIRGIASFEGLNAFTLIKYLGLIRRASYFQFISHPKLITDLEFNMVRRLFRALRKMGGVGTDHRQMPS